MHTRTRTHLFNRLGQQVSAHKSLFRSLVNTQEDGPAYTNPHYSRKYSSEEGGEAFFSGYPRHCSYEVRRIGFAECVGVLVDA